MSGQELVHVELRTGAYADSVSLLQVSRAVQGVDGVATAQVAMATTLNVEVLTHDGSTIELKDAEEDVFRAAEELGIDLSRREPSSVEEV